MSTSDPAQPSTSTQMDPLVKPPAMDIGVITQIASDDENTGASSSKPAKPRSEEDDLEKQMDQAATVEEFLQKSKVLLLDYEKHMFLDMIDTDGLVVCAK